MGDEGPVSAGPCGCLSWCGYLDEILTVSFISGDLLGGTQTEGMGMCLATGLACVGNGPEERSYFFF